MAVPLLLNDVIEVTLAGQHYGQRVLNVLHYSVDAVTPTAAMDQAWVNALAALLHEPDGVAFHFLAVVTSDYKDLKIHAQKIANVRYAKKIAAGPNPSTGVGPTNSSLPPNVAVAITRRSDQAGRGRQSTMHVPCVPEALVTAGAITPTAVGLYTELATALTLQLEVNAIVLKPVIWHRLANTTNLITSAAVEPQSRTMRRRGLGLGI